MKDKLDENMDVRLMDLLAARGHDAATVVGQRLTGTEDDGIYSVCRDEGRVLVTLDGTTKR